MHPTQASDPVFDQYSRPVLVGNGIAFILLPMIVVSLRFYARRVARVAVGLDDWCIIVALVLSTTAGIVLILAAEIGNMGQHQHLGPNGNLIHTESLSNFQKCRYINLLITTLNLGVVKISILLFYRRIFIVRPFMLASTAMIVTVTIWAVSFTTAMVAQCSPPKYFWESFEIDYPKRCIKAQMLYQGLAWSDLIFDIIVLSLPIPVVVSLQLPWKAKIKVIDVLMLGTVVLGSGIARVVSFMQVVTFTNHNSALFFKDNTYYSGGPHFWMFAESAIAIIGACLPTLAPLWSRKRSAQSKIGSSVHRPWYKPSRRLYGELEDRNRTTRCGEDDSDHHLVRLGTGTSGIANAIGLEERS